MGLNRFRGVGVMLVAPLALAEPADLALDLRPDAHGAPAQQYEIATRSNVIFPDGRGLPAGRGSVVDGAVLYRNQCSACHGLDGRGGIGGELAGGNPDLTAAQPDKTIGTYWPYATTLFDFVRRSMPLNAPWSLSNAQTYALVAYLLNLNGIVGADFVADATTLAGVRMPNRYGFVPIDASAPRALPDSPARR